MTRTHQPGICSVAGKYELSDEVVARIQAQVLDEGRPFQTYWWTGIVSHQGLTRLLVNYLPLPVK